jgi:hypothetical protein
MIKLKFPGMYLLQAVVTNHLVVRGSYRSLSLVIYGNTAEDLGQFSIEFDDSSLTNLVSSAEGKLEDLPMALHSTNRTVEDSLSSLNVLSLPVAASHISAEVKQFLQLILKLLELPNLSDSVHRVLTTVVKAVCSFVTRDLCCETVNQKHIKMCGSKNIEEFHHVINEARNELLQVLGQVLGDESAELLADCTFLESEADLATSKQLVDMLSQYFSFERNSTNVGACQLSQVTVLLLA